MLSVIVPVYNAQKYLMQCVDSLLAQTYTDLEIILVDDGSTDESPAICDGYAEKDARIRVLHKANGGAQSAIKAGIEAARGDYIGFADSDDFADPDMFGTLAELADRYDLDCAICGYRYLYEDTGEISSVDFGVDEGIYGGGRAKELCRRSHPVLSGGAKWMSLSRWNKIFKRGCIAEAAASAPEDIIFGEDMAMIMPAMLRCKRIYYIDKELYTYRRNSDSITLGAYDGRYRGDPWTLWRALEPYSDILGREETAGWIFYQILGIIRLLLCGNSSRGEKVAELKKIFCDERMRTLLKDMKALPMGRKYRAWYHIARLKSPRLAMAAWRLTHGSRRR